MRVGAIALGRRKGKSWDHRYIDLSESLKERAASSPRFWQMRALLVSRYDFNHSRKSSSWHIVWRGVRIPVTLEFIRFWAYETFLWSLIFFVTIQISYLGNTSYRRRSLLYFQLCLHKEAHATSQMSTFDAGHWNSSCSNAMTQISMNHTSCRVPLPNLSLLNNAGQDVGYTSAYAKFVGWVVQTIGVDA